MYDTVPPDFASRIKQLRQKHGLTQANLAERLGVSYVTVNRWENEAGRPSTRLWRQIAKAELLGFKDIAHDPGEPTILRESGTAYDATLDALLADVLAGQRQEGKFDRSNAPSDCPWTVWDCQATNPGGHDSVPDQICAPPVRTTGLSLAGGSL